MTFLPRHSICIGTLIALGAAQVGAVQRGWLRVTPDYDSVDAFAGALANPPPTVVRVR